MMIKGIFFQLILTGILLNSQAVFSSGINAGETDTISFAEELSSNLLKNPKSDSVPFYVNRLMKLSPVLGSKKVSALFKDAASKLENETGKGAINRQILKYSAGELDGNSVQDENSFTVLKKWNISGPWRRYGTPDIDFKFNPETVYKLEDIEKGKNLSADKNGKLYQYKSENEMDAVFYATCSFTSAEKIILWIISDADYKLMVNGKEILRSRVKSSSAVNAFSLDGARGYTVQLKMRGGKNDIYPFAKCMITDEKHNPVKLSYSATIYNFNFTSENLLNRDNSDKSLSQVNVTGIDKIKELNLSGDYYEAYKLGYRLTEKYPSYFAVYDEIIPLLDLMGRDSEFHQTVAKFIKLFPESEIHHKWLADFYMTRDKKKFADIIKSTPMNRLSQKAVVSYVYMLCGERKYFEAAALCSLNESLPYLRRLLPEVLRGSGDSQRWKKSLIDQAAVQDDGSLYYALGLAEMQSGFDPVMYWEKSYSLDGNPGLMADLSDIYENSIIAGSDFYTGEYTDQHPEFGWNGKKRKISIHIFESGRVLLKGEDTVPQGRKLRNEKYAQGGSEFSSGVIRTWIPYIKGLKILYVLTAKDGLPAAVNFETEPVSNNRLTLKYKTSVEEEFSVIKYSCEFVRDNRDPFTLANELILKSADENISWLDYEVICHGNFTPLVRYKGDYLSPGRFSDGIIRYSVVERFSKNDERRAVSVISKFSSYEVFAEWYRDVIKYAESSAADITINLSEKEDMESKIKKIHFYIMSSVSRKGDIDFAPDELDSLIKKGEGTVEERTHLAKSILESRGIKSYIAFRKNSAGLIDKILLYVPGNRDRNYWLSFYGDGISDKMEPGSAAIVITGDGYNTIPVNPETYIR